MTTIPPRSSGVYQIRCYPPAKPTSAVRLIYATDGRAMFVVCAVVIIIMFTYRTRGISTTRQVLSSQCWSLWMRLTCYVLNKSG